MKVLLADDHPLVRAGVKSTLERADGLKLVGEAANGAETLRLLKDNMPDLLILDLQMPGPSGDELARRALELVPNLKVLILTSHEDEATLRTMAGLPVSGYILKDEAAESLLQAIRAIGQGAVWFSQNIANKLLTIRNSPEKFPQLTPRERQIIELIARGLDNHAIAYELNLAEQTVRNYVSILYEKIQVNSRVEALVWAHENGLGALTT